MGWLKYLKDPHAQCFECVYLKTLNWFLTEKWASLQAGYNQEALDLWSMVARVLELDSKARRDLFLLAQSGLVGRTLANKLLWTLMTGPALEDKYLDLSNLVSNSVGKARREFDRPPRGHGDLQWWSWDNYQTPHKKRAHVLSTKCSSNSSDGYRSWRQTFATSRVCWS